jgi:transposase
MKDPKAQQRALLIMQVQAGVITATEAARQLGISRKTYYQWEARALQGLLEAVTQQPPGRPRQADRPKERQLAQQVDQLQKELDQAQESQEIRAALNRVRQSMDAKKNAAH